ncbi:hypothetical protein NP233_g11595 [Leucocoprinus birnbaumii]|uniref:Uncharacterized protein n=1 Tax=Leucocoprinus birnbaumii TaxID=56174 RepID=A0AAD5VM20_9AGAR|nr:hypothetical protein NP233_g11595 [Leucocoprinus birnbaumii]
MARSTDIYIQNISGFCAGLRVHKKKARTLEQTCVELVKVYQTILDNTGSLDVHQIEAALSRTVDFSRQWSNKSFFRQLISQRKIARGIACALKDVCDALEVLRAEQSRVYPFTSERHPSFSDVLPPPQAPQAAINSPSLGFSAFVTQHDFRYYNPSIVPQARVSILNSVVNYHRELFLCSGTLCYFVICTFSSFHSWPRFPKYLTTSPYTQSDDDFPPIATTISSRSS